MKRVSREAGLRPAVAARHRGTKLPGDAKPPATVTVRVQLHLGETTSKRLSVHAALVGRNASRVADEILTGYLARFGRGREIFESSEEAAKDDPGDTEDRTKQRAGISPDDQEAA
jgi:hypothetical protein